MGKAIKILITLIVVLLVLVIGLGAMIKFDVLGIGNGIFRDLLEDIPVISNILPESPVTEESADSTSYNFETVEEAVEILKLTEEMLKKKGEEAEKLSEQLTQQNAEIERLKVFEANQLAFEADKAAFDEQIVASSPAVDFKIWYETMYPENAAKLYSEVVGIVEADTIMKGFISIYQNMKADEAAAILEGMTTTKMDQVATIIKGLTPDHAADVLGSMDPTVAAKITSYIYP